MNEIQTHWNQRYVTKNTPWNSGYPSQELQRVLREQLWSPGRILELGCGSGTNAVFLAEQGFEVTAVDVASVALEQAQQLARQREVQVNWLQADVCCLKFDVQPFDYVFDRGCYHCVRRRDLPGFLKTIEDATRAGSRLLLLTGNANEQRDHGPPPLHEHEIRAELSGLCEVNCIRPFHFEDAGHIPGPLGWSCQLTRK